MQQEAKDVTVDGQCSEKLVEVVVDDGHRPVREAPETDGEPEESDDGDDVTGEPVVLVDGHISVRRHRTLDSRTWHEDLKQERPGDVGADDGHGQRTGDVDVCPDLDDSGGDAAGREDLVETKQAAVATGRRIPKKNNDVGTGHHEKERHEGLMETSSPRTALVLDHRVLLLTKNIGSRHVSVVGHRSRFAVAFRRLASSYCGRPGIVRLRVNERRRRVSVTG